jgi:5-histidylcysteine sulfoxide synthase/putative 4-mercaptohistidine N1-methyltranferase
MTLIHTPVLNAGNPEDKRNEILNYFLESCEVYESLFSLLNCDEAYYQAPEPLRHPLIFYYGHTATFFINKLIQGKLISKRVNPEFESIFAIGVDEMSWDDLSTKSYNWPEVSAVKAYRQVVKDLVIETIKNMDVKIPIAWNDPIWAILMGIEHERIHLETSSVIMRQLDLKYITPQPVWEPCQEFGTGPSNSLQSVAACEVMIHKQKSSSLYSWDNENGSHSAKVSSFNASKFLVSNQEFFEFVKDNGYQQRKYWEEEGQKWLAFSKLKHPRFWIPSGLNQFDYRALSRVMEMPWNWPVDVNYHEAKAFCNWMSDKTGKKIRLPSEDEWLALRNSVELNTERYDAGFNINLNHGASACAVDKFKTGNFYDIVGNVWQWTETPIYPFTDFEVHPLYDDFTIPTFDNRHNLIKGGSWISTGNSASKHSRYAFRRHFFQHAGFRYIEAQNDIKITDYNYESDTQVSQYSEFHYGDEYFGVKNFAKASADFCIKHSESRKTNKALDLGCAVGRSSFELAKIFTHVIGIDFSARFIKTAFEMQERGEIRYTLIDEGELCSYKTRRMLDLGLADIANKVEFQQGDACNLKSQLTGFDLVFMGNLIDRLYDPKKLLLEIHHRINIGGLLVIASPYTWLEEYTKRENWLGGFKGTNGENLTTTDALSLLLDLHFKRIEAPVPIEFVIRETKRKFQHTVSEFNVFERIN